MSAPLPPANCDGCGRLTTDYTRHDVFSTTHIVCAACGSAPAPTVIEGTLTPAQRDAAASALMLSEAAVRGFTLDAGDPAVLEIEWSEIADAGHERWGTTRYLIDQDGATRFDRDEVPV